MSEYTCGIALSPQRGEGLILWLIKNSLKSVV